MSGVVNVNKIIHADFVSSSQQVRSSVETTAKILRKQYMMEQQITTTATPSHSKENGETVATTTFKGGHAATKLARQVDSC